MARGPGRRMRCAGPGPGGDPFAVLGLERAAQLTDEDVRTAWRRIAAATHPDRADGGDPDRFALAAAAGWGSPAAPALVVGALTWFLVTAARGDTQSAGVGAGRDRPGRVERPLRPPADVERS